MQWTMKLFTLSIQVNTCKYWMLFEYEFSEWGVRISEVRINEGLLYYSMASEMQNI